MATIILRLGKGSPLTNSELDANFTNLNTELGTKASTSSLASVAFTGSYSSLAGTPTLGTAAAKDIPATGNASATQVVYGTDTRLSDARTPTAHNQAWSTINNTPTTLAGYGITDAYNSSNPAGYISGITSANVTTALGFTPYNATNPSGYVNTAGARAAISVTGSGSYDSATGIITVTGGVTSVNSRTGAVTISSADVTGALGFTPYNSSNPSGYITGITSGNVTTALGYTPNAVNFSRFAGDLNTLGVSNATSGVYDIGAGYTNGPGSTTLYGTLQAYWNGDIAVQFWHTYNGDSYWRKSIGSTFSGAAWRTNLDSVNYNSYSPTLTGTGASGTWGISITGNAATVTSITSSQVTTALGYTPYNSSNPAGYISSYTETSTLANVTGRGNTTTTRIGVATTSPLDFVASGNTGTWLGGIQDSTSGWSLTNGVIGIKSDNSTYAAIGIATAGGLLYFGRTAASGAGTMSSWLEVNSSGIANFKLARPQHNGSNLALVSEIPSLSGYLPLTGGTLSGSVRVNSIFYAGQNTNGTAQIDAYGGFAYYGCDSSSTGMKINSSGNATFYADARSPIFYDSNDTTYYVDPNNMSSMFGVAIRGDNSSTGTNNQIFFWGAGNTTTSAIGFKANGGYFGNPTGNGDGYNTYLTMDSDGRGWVFRRGVGGSDFGAAYTSGWILNNGVWQANASMRAPTFYDSDNTAYYVNPNGGTVLSGTGITIGSRLSLFDDGNVHIHATSGPMWLNASDGSTINLNGQTSGFTYLANSARSPIFYDYNDTGYYVDANNGTRLNSLTINDGNVQLYKSQTVDLSNTGVYSTSNYYPVVIGVPADGVWIEIQNNLNSNVPSWATHGAGFTLNLRWFTTGSGWGTTEIKRRVEQYHERFTNATICGGITQLSQSSSEIVWLRGGGTYYFKYSKNLSATPYSSTYSANGQSASPTSSAQNSVWNSAAGAHVSYNTDVYADSRMDSPIFYDRNDTGYYANLNDNSYLNTLNVAFTNFRVHMDVYGPIYSYKNDLGYILQTFNQSAGNPGQFNIRHDYGNVIMENTRGNTYVYGNAVITNNSLRAPIFYDSDNTGYYCDPTGTSVLNTISAQGNVFTAGYVQTNASGVKWDQSGVRSWSMYPSGGDMYLTSGDTSGSFYVTLTGGVRSPIFYDSNDTAYFIDPNSSHSIRVAGQITASNYMVGGLRNGALNIGRTDTNYDWGTSTAWGSYTSVGILANCSDNWEMAIHDSGERVVSPFAFFGGGSNYILMGRDIGWGTTYIQAANSFRAPIFYDSNDTGYYTDPNGTSYLNVVGAAGRFYTGYDSSQPNSFSCSNWFRSSGNTGWYNASYGVGIYAVDSTWVRTYNSAQFYSDTIIQAGASVRAPIFYDSGDTSFYCDPNGTSRLSTIRTTEHMFINHSNPTIHFVDSDERGAALHNNSNLFYILSSNGTGGESWTQNNGYWPFYINLNSNDATFGGAIWAAGNITAYSDIKLKENIQTIDSALEKVLKLRGVYYTLKRDETKTRKVGVIAQEMQEVLPEVVVLHKDVEDTEGTLAVDYGNISGLLIEAIKEQNQEIVDLRNRVAQLESLIHKLIGEQP